TSQNAQERGLPASRGAEQSDDLARLDGEIGRPHDLDARAVGLRIGFFHRDGFDDGFTHKRLRKFYTRFSEKAERFSRTIHNLVFTGWSRGKRSMMFRRLPDA